MGRNLKRKQGRLSQGNRCYQSGPAKFDEAFGVITVVVCDQYVTKALSPVLRHRREKKRQVVCLALTSVNKHTSPSDSDEVSISALQAEWSGILAEHAHHQS